MQSRFRVGLLAFSSLASSIAPTGALLSGVGVNSLAVAGLTLALLPSGAAHAAPDTAADIALPSGPMKAALFALAKQTGVQIVFTPEMVAGRTVAALNGRLSAREALARLIAGSDLEMRQAGAKVLVLRSKAAVMRTATPTDSDALGQATRVDSAALPADPPEDAVQLSEIVVGTHIRGVKDSASPVIVLARDDLDQAGRASVADALSALPQAFVGRGTEGTLTTSADPTGTNASRSTGVNLRGLGTDATLVLVNGRRLAGTGLRGDFADTSSIPMAAVDRIEVLLDGASALYGSDAVGGVVNIVLRKRFDGAETRVLAGGATQGGATQWSIGQTVGKAWDSGSAMISYEHSNRDRLRGIDRPFASNADLRARGGADHRRFYASPGNILRADATGVLNPAYAIPAGQSGVGLTPASFLAGQVNLENQLTAYDILPRQRRDSVYVALAQDVTPAIDLSADLRASRRHFTNRSSASSATITVNRTNPYFVSPTGAASERIAYSFLRELGGQLADGVADTIGLSLGGEVRLPKGWRLEAYGAYGMEGMRSLTNNLVNTTYLAEATGSTANSPLTTFNPAVDGYFNPFIGAGANAKNILAFVGSGYISRKTRGETSSTNLKIDGTLFSLPAGPVGVAIGGQVRNEGLKTSAVGFTSGFTPIQGVRRAVERTVNAAFAEVRVPLFGGAFTRPGFTRLELSAAVRRDDYGHGLASTDPKLGAIWSPVQGLTFKGSYGESFRAPALVELSDPQVIAPTTIVAARNQTIVMVLTGGNTALKPETATSKALTVDLAPPAFEGFKASLTWFDTRYTNRIGQPGSDYINIVLTQPEFAAFVTRVTPATNAADRAKVQALIDDPRSVAQGVFPVESYGAIIDARYVNTGQLRVRGFDLQAQYRMKVAGEPVALSADLSWLTNFDRKITPTARAIGRAGYATEPADFRGRYAAAWTRGPVTTTASVTHVGDFKTDAGPRVKSWTTADLNVRYAFKRGRLAGTRLALNVQNLFDKDPPFYETSGGLGFDATAASALGRVVTLQLTKTW